MNDIPALTSTRLHGTQQTRRTPSESTVVPVDSRGTALSTSEVGLRQVMAVSGQPLGAVQNTPSPAIVSSLVDVIGDGFIQYAPPQPERSLGTKLKDAVKGVLAPVGQAAKWIGSIGSAERQAKRL